MSRKETVGRRLSEKNRLSRSQIVSTPKQLFSIARVCSTKRLKGTTAEAVSYRQELAGNLVSFKVIEASRANVRKLIFRKCLTGSVVLFYTRRFARRHDRAR